MVAVDRFPDENLSPVNRSNCPNGLSPNLRYRRRLYGTFARWNENPRRNLAGNSTVAVGWWLSQQPEQFGKMVTCAVCSVIPQCLEEFKGMEGDRVKFFMNWQTALFRLKGSVRDRMNFCQSQSQSIAFRDNGRLSRQPPNRRRTVVHQLVKGNKGFHHGIFVLRGARTFKILAKFLVSILNCLFRLPLFSVKVGKKLKKSPFDGGCQKGKILSILLLIGGGNRNTKNKPNNQTKDDQPTHLYHPCRYCSDKGGKRLCLRN